MSLSAEAKKFLNSSIEESKKNIETIYIETGNIGFDLALTNGHGLPIGSSTLLWADPGCGKTTLVGDVSKRLLDRAKNIGEPFKILYIATEPSKNLLKDLGLGEYMESGDFIYIEKQHCWRYVELYYEAVLQDFDMYKDVKLIVIDSINNVLSDQNLNKSGADGDFGTKAKERGNFYSKYLPRCLQKGVTSFFIAQARQNQGAGMFQDAKKAAASFADRHNVEIILKCGKKTNKTDAGKVNIKTIFGDVQEQRKYIMTLTSSQNDCKNRYFQGTPSEVLVVKGKGIDNAYVVKKLLEGNGYLKSSAGWYTFNKEIASLINAPTNKLRLIDVNTHIRSNIGTLVQFLQQEKLYKIEVSEENLGEDEDFEGGEDSSNE